MWRMSLLCTCWSAVGYLFRDVDEAVSLTKATPSAVLKVTVEDKESEIVENNNNPSDEAVMSDTAGLKVSGCQHKKKTSGSAIPFNSEQNCIQANADSQGNIDMLENFVEINSIGLSEAHFDIVRIGKEAINICVGTITVAQEATSEQSSCWGFTFEELKTEQGKDKALNNKRYQTREVYSFPVQKLNITGWIKRCFS